jgi:hypothetical protein
MNLGIQSTRLFLQSYEFGPPPSTRKRVCPLPLFLYGGGGTQLACGEGVGVRIRQFGRGERHCGNLGIHVLCGSLCEFGGGNPKEDERTTRTSQYIKNITPRCKGPTW